MADAKRHSVDIRVGVPGLTVGTKVAVPARRRGSTGPFLLVARACGLALDTALPDGPGQPPNVWPPHGEPHQLWYLDHEKDGFVRIRSASNDWFLDVGQDPSAKHPFLAFEGHRERWQRWMIEPVEGDGMGVRIQSVYTRRLLTAGAEFERNAKPLLANKSDGGRDQEWLILKGQAGTR